MSVYPYKNFRSRITIDFYSDEDQSLVGFVREYEKNKFIIMRTKESDHQVVSYHNSLDSAIEEVRNYRYSFGWRGE